MDTIRLKYTDIFEGKEKELIFSRHLIKKDFKESSLFAVLVDGKSMQPVINDKAVIVVDLSQKEIEEGLYILYYENKMWVKKYNTLNRTFASINPDFSDLVYKKEDVHIVGKVLLTFTNF